MLPDLTPTAVALHAAGLPLTALFGPEHGLRGTAQAGASEDAFEPVRTALVMLRVLNELYPDDFGMLPSLDRLWGSDSLRKALDAGDDPLDLLPAATTPAGWVRPGVLLYAGA